MKRAVWLAIVALLISFVAHGGQSNSVSSQQARTFRTTSRIVAVDVVVTDHAGHPVTNLTADDFAVFEDGVQQKIASFESPTARSVASQESDKPAPASGRTEISENSSPTIFLLDELNTQFWDTAYGRFELGKLLQRQPELQRPAAILRLTLHGLVLVSDYTRDAGALQAALKRAEPQSVALMARGKTALMAERVNTSLKALDQIAVANEGPKGRKNLIWVGSGFRFVSEIVASSGDPSATQLLKAIHDTAARLQDAHVSVYVLDPRGITVFPDGYVPMNGASPQSENMHTGQDAMLLQGEIMQTGGSGVGAGYVAFQDTAGDIVLESVADETGGQVLPARNDLDGQMAHVIVDGQSYYSLSYYPSNKNWNGAFRKIRVRVRQAGLIVRARSGYFANDDSKAAGDSTSVAVIHAMGSPVPYVGIAFDAAAKMSATPQKSLEFALQIEARSLSWSKTPGGDLTAQVTIVIADFSTAGVLLRHQVSDRELTIASQKLPKTSSEIVVTGPVSMAAKTEMLPAEASRIRLVVLDKTTGRIGTRDLPTNQIAGYPLSK